jgi:hypothetical protein
MQLESRFSDYMHVHDTSFNPAYRGIHHTDIRLGNGQTSKIWQNGRNDIVGSELYDQSGKELGYSMFDPITGKLTRMVKIADGKEIPSRFDDNGMLIPTQPSNDSNSR